MNIYEYQAKEVLRKYGINVPDGSVASTPQEAEQCARKIKGEKWVVKAQVKVGGRGKAGGVQIAQSLEEVARHTGTILNTPLKTYQSGSAATKVKKVLIEECCDIDRELYCAIAIDRIRSKIVVIASSQGGVEIEETAKKNPSAIFKEYIDPAIGMMPFQARKLCFQLGITDKETSKSAIKCLMKLYEAFVRCDCMLAEINPLVITSNKTIVALDAKISFDDSALLRQREIAAMRDSSEELPAEKIARESNLNYIGLEGNIGCMVNGAGLAMATMDTIKIYGGEPANFLDVGGGASSEMVTKAFQILLSSEKVKAILVNIFGGILKCDVLAEGIVKACQKIKPNVPLVVRLEGTNVERGREILASAELNIISAGSMKEAAQEVVRLA